MRLAMWNAWFILFLLLQTGCTFISNLSLGPALLRSPVTLNTKDSFGPLNGPLTADEACRLNLISEDISNGKSKKQAVENNWLRRDQCTRHRTNESGNHITSNQIDLFEDLTDQEVLVFVAISGGGTRAASLAAHSMSLLEKTLARIQRDMGLANRIPLVKLVDAFSTVSGGSLYAYQVARAKSFVDLVAPESRRAVSDSKPINDRAATITTCNLNLDEPESNEQLIDRITNYEDCFFYNVSRGWAARNIGLMASAFYLSPFNAFIGPAITLTTDISYIDVLAETLSFTGYSVPYKLSRFALRHWNELSISEDEHARLDRINGGLLIYPNFNAFELKMGDITQHPRFFFNTTALETGLPVVLTQRITHLPSDRFQSRTARLDKLIRPSRPLAHAYTLEEMNSSPASMPLAYAAMSSSSFPFGLEPVRLQKYGFMPGYEAVYETSEKLHVTDGGVYDNSGLTTLTDLYSHLSSNKGVATNSRKQVLVLLSINAEADDYSVTYPTRLALPKPWYDSLPFPLFDFNFIPFRVESLGVKAMEVIHFSNKRRAEEMAINEILRINEAAKNDLVFLPVSFSQLSPNDPNSIPDTNQLFESIKGIPTTFGLSSDDDFRIEQAANVIVTSEQRHGWNVGPKCLSGIARSVENKGDQSVAENNKIDLKSSRNLFSEIRRLDEAFAFAVLRKLHSKWDAPELEETSEQSLVKEWCSRHVRSPE